MTKLVETPVDDHSRVLYTSLVHKHNSIAELKFVIAKLSFFILEKQYYKYFPTKHNINDEIIIAFPKHVLPSTDSSFHPPTAVVPPLSSSYVLIAYILNFLLILIRL